MTVKQLSEWLGMFDQDLHVGRWSLDGKFIEFDGPEFDIEFWCDGGSTCTHKRDGLFTDRAIHQQRRK